MLTYRNLHECDIFPYKTSSKSIARLTRSIFLYRGALEVFLNNSCLSPRTHQRTFAIRHDLTRTEGANVLRLARAICKQGNWGQAAGMADFGSFARPSASNLCHIIAQKWRLSSTVDETLRPPSSNPGAEPPWQRTAKPHATCRGDLFDSADRNPAPERRVERLQLRESHRHGRARHPEDRPSGHGRGARLPRAGDVFRIEAERRRGPAGRGHGRDEPDGSRDVSGRHLRGGGPARPVRQRRAHEADAGEGPRQDRRGGRCGPGRRAAPKVGKAMFFHTAGYHFPYKNMHYVAAAGGNVFYEKTPRTQTSTPFAATPIPVAAAEPPAAR